MKWISALLLIALPLAAGAQDSLSVDLQADIVSNYVWRGLKLGHVSFQPTMAVSWKGLSLEASGNTGLTNHEGDNNEIDLTLSYETGGLSLGVVDDWSDENDARFFYYKKDATGHIFEGFVKYDFGPVCASWQTFFAGNDYQDDDGKRAYSSYLELTAPFQLGGFDWQATAGAVPWASDYYDTSGFRVTNLSLKATKDIKITNTFSLPLFGELVGNPTSQNFYFIAGFTLQVF